MDRHHSLDSIHHFDQLRSSTVSLVSTSVDWRLPPRRQPPLLAAVTAQRLFRRLVLAADHPEWRFFPVGVIRVSSSSVPVSHRTQPVGQQQSGNHQPIQSSSHHSCSLEPEKLLCTVSVCTAPVNRVACISIARCWSCACNRESFPQVSQRALAMSVCQKLFSAPVFTCTCSLSEKLLSSSNRKPRILFCQKSSASCSSSLPRVFHSRDRKGTQPSSCRKCPSRSNCSPRACSALPSWNRPNSFRHHTVLRSDGVLCTKMRKSSSYIPELRAKGSTQYPVRACRLRYHVKSLLPAIVRRPCGSQEGVNNCVTYRQL